MSCTKRWSHLAEGNQPCVPRLVSARSHSWGRKRAVQGSGLSGSPCLVEGKPAVKGAFSNSITNLTEADHQQRGV